MERLLLCNTSLTNVIIAYHINPQHQVSVPHDWVLAVGRQERVPAWCTSARDLDTCMSQTEISVDQSLVGIPYTLAPNTSATKRHPVYIQGWSLLGC